MTFSISNQPLWTSFNTTTGRLSGTPLLADTDTYAGIIISVNDGTTSVALPSFMIEVLADQDAKIVKKMMPYGD